MQIHNKWAPSSRLLSALAWKQPKAEHWSSSIDRGGWHPTYSVPCHWSSHHQNLFRPWTPHTGAPWTKWQAPAHCWRCPTGKRGGLLTWHRVAPVMLNCAPLWLHYCIGASLTNFGQKPDILGNPTRKPLGNNHDISSFWSLMEMCIQDLEAQVILNSFHWKSTGSPSRALKHMTWLECHWIHRMLCHLQAFEQLK